ncbi:hypothetical protein [Photobacterium ganghwense]|uniref:hypothetical protein n=1 Tax=Photobacterium ganghwense TaxID=320778 RepID=UPI001A8D4352|nr:hypothetical protein [Photobacterium ganghwense]QSV17307.1 hypothetical protein FH974_20480 [Photobacterium ganghwense]
MANSDQVTPTEIRDIEEKVLGKLKDEVWKSAIELAKHRYVPEQQTLKAKIKEQEEELRQIRMKLETEEARVNQLRLELRAAENDASRYQRERDNAREHIVLVNDLCWSKILERKTKSSPSNVNKPVANKRLGA